MPYTLNVFTGQFDYYASLAIGSSVLNGTTGSVLFIGSSGEIAQDNTNFFWDDTNNLLRLKTLHVGTEPSVNYPMNVNVTPILDGSSWLAENFFTTHTATANFSESVTALFAQTTIQTVGYTASGVITGLFGNVRMNTPGTAASLLGMRAGITNSSTGTVTTAIGFGNATFTNIGGGTIVNSYGFYTPDQTAATNIYGFVGQISSGSTKWNLYMSGTAKNYLAGNLGIGISSPGFLLDVQGPAAAIISSTGYADTASGGSFLGRKARGTQGSPTKALADDKLSAWGGRGYVQGSGFQSTSSGRFQIAAAEDYNSTSNLGSYMIFEVTPIGSGTIFEAMRIASTGNVGIGSSAPASMLTVGATNGMSSKLVTVSDVTSPTSAAGASGISVVLQGGGGIYMKDNGNGVEGKFEAYGGAMGIGTMTTHALGLWADNGEKMTILAGGNVGIGNTSPSAVLHIKAGTTAASTAPIKLTSGSFNTTAEAGTMEYNNAFALTESDATRRYIVQAASSTKTTAGAPYTNDGYVTVRINGVDVKLMTTA